jgi:hypothetical protein
LRDYTALIGCEADYGAVKLLSFSHLSAVFAAYTMNKKLTKSICFRLT